MKRQRTDRAPGPEPAPRVTAHEPDPARVVRRLRRVLAAIASVSWGALEDNREEAYCLADYRDRCEEFRRALRRVYQRARLSQRS